LYLFSESLNFAFQIGRLHKFVVAGSYVSLLYSKFLEKTQLFREFGVQNVVTRKHPLIIKVIKVEHLFIINYNVETLFTETLHS